MQIILLEKVTNVGNLGDIVKVKDGFARNFLIPQGKARRATAENITMLEEKRVDLERIANEKLTSAQDIGEKLNGLTVQITQKAGVDGRLFGSVTNGDIAEALKAQGFKVEKSNVHLAGGHLKMIGDHHVQVQLHTDVKAEITVHVIGDNS
jgi:large subunit ribosomal protein L9